MAHARTLSTFHVLTRVFRADELVPRRRARDNVPARVQEERDGRDLGERWTIGQYSTHRKEKNPVRLCAMSPTHHARQINGAAFLLLHVQRRGDIC